jgi:hypothetical protein
MVPSFDGSVRRSCSLNSKSIKTLNGYRPVPPATIITLPGVNSCICSPFSTWLAQSEVVDCPLRKEGCEFCSGIPLEKGRDIVTLGNSSFALGDNCPLVVAPDAYFGQSLLAKVIGDEVEVAGIKESN